MTYSVHNFSLVFSNIKSAGIKLIPALLLICSFVVAQNISPPKHKIKKDKQKHKIEKQKPDSIPQHFKDSMIEIDQVTPEDTSTFDPMDTTHLRRSKDALTKSVKYKCNDSIVYYSGKKIIYLYGDAKVYYDDLTLTADFITIQLDKNLVTALPTVDTAGKFVVLPKFKQGQQEFSMYKIQYNFGTKRASLSNLKTREGEGFIVGNQVIKNEFNELGIRNSSYTTCDADTPHFAITAAKLKVIPDKKVVALWPNLIIEGINTPLIFPFAIFPIKKGQSSGLIIPQYGSDISRGFFLRAGGYYWGLGEHADLQLTCDIYSNLSWGGHSVFRYSSRYHFNGNVILNYADNQYGLPEDPGFHKDKGFQFTWLHSQDPKARPGSNFSANVNIASSTYLANNSYNPANIVTNQLSSSIAYSKSMGGGKYNFSTNASVAQNTSTRDINIAFPNFNFSVSSFNPLKPKYKSIADKWYENITMNYNGQFSNQFNSKDSLLFRSRTATDLNAYFDSTDKFGMIHTLPISTTFKLFKYYTLSTQVAITDYMYYKTIRRSLDSENVNVVTKNVDGFQNALTYRPSAALSTKFYGMALFKNGPISAFRHVMTPTIGLSYVPDFSDPGYGYYKTYKDATGKDVKYSIFEGLLFGGPSTGKQGNIDFSLDNNLEMKVWKGKDTARKEEKVQLFSSLRAGGSYNLFADSLKLSMISLSASTRLFKNISVNASSSLDPYVNVIDIDTANGHKTPRRINTFYLSDRAIPGIIKTASIGLSATFNPALFKSNNTVKDKDGYAGELKYLNDFPSEYVRFDVPWSLTINYTIGYDMYANLNNPSANNFVQTLSYSGDFSLTKKWKITYNSGYDFNSKQVSFTSINIVRDLHCWEFKFDWIPFGPRQSFLFTIKVKASMLQDLKQTRRREWFDRTI